MNSNLTGHFTEEDLSLALETLETHEEKEKYRYAFLKNNCLCRYIDIGDRTTTDERCDKREKIISALGSDRLYLSPNKYYNDAFDTMMFVDFNALKTEITNDINICMPIYAENIKSESPDKALFAAYISKNENERIKLINNFLINIEEHINDVKSQIRNGIKSVCLSKNFNSAIMWAHYANNCQGISLLYDKKELITAPCYTEDNKKIDLKFELKDIEYQEYRYDATRDFADMVTSRESCLSHKATKNIIITKSKDWDYEQEVRLIPRKLDYIKETEAKYLSIRPKAIIFGKDIRDEDRQEIVNTIKEKDIILYESWLNNNQKGYQVVVQRWYP